MGQVDHERTAPETDSAPGVDGSEIVGPGRYPLRIQPAAALLPGRGDSRRLLIVWFARKSFYWLFFVGYCLGTWAAYLDHSEGSLDVDWTSPDSVRQGLLSPWSALIVALMVRFAANWVALGLAMPLALGHEPNLTPRTNFGSGIGRFFDRLNLARAFRSLRWTHHVRQVALARLGRTGRRLGRLDPALDLLNIASGVGAFVLVVWVASRTAG